MPIEAVLFDLDGTLLDTLDDIADSANTVLGRRGYATHAVDDYRFLVGDGVVKLIERSLPADAMSEELVERCVHEMREEYGHRWNAKTRPYDGVTEMLDGVVERGAKLAVLSNKPHGFTVMCVEGLLAGWSFDAVAGQGHGRGRGFPHKPDPAGALELARRMGVGPEGIVFLGDSGVDMQTAVNAGMYPAGATWGFRPREELTGAGARELLDRPEDLLALMDSLQGESR